MCRELWPEDRSRVTGPASAGFPEVLGEFRDWLRVDDFLLPTAWSAENLIGLLVAITFDQQDSWGVLLVAHKRVSPDTEPGAEAIDGLTGRSRAATSPGAIGAARSSGPVRVLTRASLQIVERSLESAHVMTEQHPNRGTPVSTDMPLWTRRAA